MRFVMIKLSSGFSWNRQLDQNTDKMLDNTYKHDLKS